MGKRVVVDRAAGEVQNVLDFVFWKWRRRYPLGAFKKVALRHEVMRSSPTSKRVTSTSFYTVLLLQEPGPPVTLAIVDRKDEAGRLAHEMSTELGLSFVDETGEE